MMIQRLQHWSRADWSLAVLVILYSVGIVGALLPLHPDFMLLTPANLLISLVLMLWNHPHWSQRTVVFLALCYVVGFGAEMFGVQTGLLFGDYAYGPVLGPKVLGTPLMIGVNWMMLAYASGVVANSLLQGSAWWWRALVASLLMVALDFLIEPVAMRFDFWDWEGGIVPLSNYVGWFFVALPLVSVFAIYQASVRNKVAVGLFILQFVFFLTLGLFS
jgi:putative membrane protein